MSYLHKYQDKAAYTAATDRPANSPNVSLAGEEVIFDPVNTAIPFERGQLQVGDHLVYDKVEHKHKVIRNNGFKLANLDTSRYIDGKAVFFANIGDKAYFIGVESLGDKMFSQYSRCKLTGFDLENGGTAKLTGQNFSCEFSYDAGATYTEIAAAMTAAKTGSYATYYIFSALADGIGVRTWPTELTVASGGLSIEWLKAIKADGTEVDGKVSWDTLANYCDLTEIGCNAMDMRGMDGIVRLHKKQYIESIRTLASATTFGDEATVFMNQTTFNRCSDGTVGGDDGIALYNKYSGDYYAYADVCASMRLINYDVPYKTAETLRTGEKATKELAGVKMYDFDGSIINAFPAAATAEAYGITTDGFVTGFEPGNWHQNGVGELARIMRYATSRTSTLDPDDILNKAIVAGGGTPIVGNVTHALCGANSVNSWLVFIGNSGSLTYGNRVLTFRVRVSLALDYDNLNP